jgi:hypothetical protein
MKRITFYTFIAVTGLLISACSNKSGEEQMHDHGDGNAHSHDQEEMHAVPDTVKQESFTVDSTSADHHHDGNMPHDHEH